MDLNTLNRPELLALCKARGIKGVVAKKKEEIVVLLSATAVVPKAPFYSQPYETLKVRYDNDLNKDKSLFTSSNDEPTPIGCIEEMMAAVPADFWSQKGLRILDPCCGNGNFHFVIGTRLLAGGYDATEVADTLHFNDTNESRLKQVRAIFGSSAKITSNDFLAIPTEGLYDMVVMNPPYARLMPDGKRASKNHGLAVSFLTRGLNALADGGFLVAIVPDSWMSLADRNDFCDLITQYQFHTLNIHCAKSWFPKVGSSFTWFVVQKVAGVKPFKVAYLAKGSIHKSMVNSQRRPFIPLQWSSHIQSIFEKTVDNSALPKYAVETSSNLHRYTQREFICDEPDATHKWRLIHTPKQTAWASRPHKFQEGWKIFLSTTDKYKAFPDNCGMTQSIAFIRVGSEEEAKRISEILMHPLYVFLNNACRYGNFNNIRVLQRFPVCSGDPFVAFGLTAEEIAVVAA